MPHTKIDHKEFQRRLKEDEVAHFFQEAIHWVRKIYSQYGLQTGLGLACILLLFASIYLWRLNTSNEFTAYQQLYGNAVTFLTPQQNAQPDYVNAQQELDTILKQYSGSPVAKLARVLRASGYVKMKQYDLALPEYRAALSDFSREDQIPIHVAIVQTLRDLGKTDEALQELETLSKKAKSVGLKHQILYLKGCCYEDKNETAKSLEFFKSIPTDSGWYSLAYDRISWLEAEAAEAINS